MNIKEDILYCLNYITEHLDEEFSLRELAEEMGYSYHYFCNLFSLTVGIPLAEYIRKLRLDQAAASIAHGKPISEVAKANGFQTLSGFNKAFKREYLMSPSDYSKENRMVMPPRFIHCEAIRAVGYNLSPMEGREWDPYSHLREWHNVSFHRAAAAVYQKLAAEGRGEISLWHHPEERNGSRTYFFGPVVSEFPPIPQDMVCLELTPSDYAVFTTVPPNIAKGRESFRKALDDLWAFILLEWSKMPRCGRWKFSFQS